MAHAQRTVPHLVEPIIPLLNLRKLYQAHRSEFLTAMEEVLDKAAFIGGEALTQFERNFAAWVGPSLKAVGCANGTDAITLGAEALDLPEGAEAIVPAMTFVATPAALIRAGLKVKLVDIQEGTYLIDPKKVEKVITANTKLIAPVHLYGQMAEMDAVRQIADGHECMVLEDAAQAHGATWKGQPVGTWGDLASFSFYPGKNLGAFGDAGGILSRNKQLIEKCTALGHQGGLKKYEHNFLGHNSRLDNLQAAVLNVKLKYLSSWNESRRNVARMYRELLSDIDGLILPREASHAKHVYHLYVVQVEKREDFIKFAKEKGVETGIHYPKAIHELPCFQDQPFASESFPNAEKLAQHGVSLPMCPTLTVEQVERVGRMVRSYFGK